MGRYGSLFSGYAGLDMGLQSVLGGSTAWHVEFDKAPSAILAHHWPDVPNYGDITTVDWSTVEPVDVLTGGFPCQDVSHAGRRAGLIRDGEGRTRSGLWGEMLRAVTQLRPALVVAENVRGLLSARADSDVEPCPWCLGDDDSEPAMRALGAVLADLADVGYDAAWYGLRAADVGAAHGRFRVFIFATPAGHTESVGREWGQAQLAGPLHKPAGDGARAGMVRLLPTPTTEDHGTDAPNRVGSPSLSTDFVTRNLLPTPRATDGTKWGDYAPAIARWEAVIGRPAPEPTEPGPKGNPRLSATFVEWLMGLPAGHVTDVPGLSRNHQLKALGNGVVPAQAEAATRAFLADLDIFSKMSR